MNEAILQLSNVTYQYKSKYQSVTAVNDFSFEFYDGKLYSIIGKSGSGKTTLLSLMAGLDNPSSGYINFQNKDLKCMNLDDYRKYDISVIYQDFNLFPMFTSLENVMYPMELQKKTSKLAKTEAIKLLDLLDLKKHCYNHYPHMLSGGEKQRIAIARSLAAEPKIIFADEPTGNLDEVNTQNIIHILKELAHKYNYCVILITHDLDIAKQSDVSIELKDGKLHQVIAY